MSALTVTGLRSGYDGTEILHGLDIEVGRGEIVALLGRNGVGKSTLIRTIMGIVRARAGRIEIGHLDVTALAPHRIARSGVAYVPQEGPLFDELSVRANLEVVLSRRRNVGDARSERVFTAFPVLRERLNQVAGTLSGGERKMLMMARVLLQDPDLVLLDEVTEGLQPSAVAQVGQAIHEAREEGASVLLVEQKIDFALTCAGRVLVMKHGEIVAASDVKKITANEIERHLVL
jgi:urea transport system ATP-binding protein